MVRELVVLGSSSQVPTRHRNHNGYLLRWDGGGILFDPGEGTQRQLLLAGVPVSAVTTVLVTHFHGDHCLGLPGVVQRLSLDGVTRPVTVAFPADGWPYFERLRHASSFEDRTDLRRAPVAAPDDGTPVVVVDEPAAGVRVLAAALRHAIPTVGWRLEEPSGRTMLPDRLAAAGVAGPDVGRLQRDGALTVGGRRVTVEEVSVERPGQRVAFVMDTGWCAGALALAEGADLLVCEATFSEAERDLAHRWGHLTAAQAGRLAAESGVRRLVLTHFSQRHPDVAPLVDEAAVEFGGDLVAARDLLRVPVPARRGGRGTEGAGREHPARPRPLPVDGLVARSPGTGSHRQAPAPVRRPREPTMAEHRTPTQTQTVAVLGTGVMGAPMARNLAASGLAVRVWNRTREKAEALRDAGVTVCDSPDEAVKGADCLLTMLGDGHAVEAAVLGEGGALEQPAPGLLWIQSATVGVEAADRFARLAGERGVDFVDAPVLGTRKPAEDGALVVLASGPDALHDRCRPVFEAIARRILWVGGAGSGSRLKLAVNNWVLSIVGAVSESIALCEAVGLDPDLFLEAIDGTPTDSPYAHVKGKAMIEGDFGPSFPAAGARKDAELIVTAMREHGVAGEMAEGLLRKFEQTVAEGHGDDDMAAAVLHSRAVGGGAR